MHLLTLNATGNRCFHIVETVIFFLLIVSMCQKLKEILHKIFHCKSVVLNKEQILSLAIDIFGHNVYYDNIKPIKQIGLV